MPKASAGGFWRGNLVQRFCTVNVLLRSVQRGLLFSPRAAVRLCVRPLLNAPRTNGRCAHGVWCLAQINNK